MWSSYIEPVQPSCSLILSYFSLRSQLGIRPFSCTLYSNHVYLSRIRRINPEPLCYSVITMLLCSPMCCRCCIENQAITVLGKPGHFTLDAHDFECLEFEETEVCFFFFY